MKNSFLNNDNQDEPCIETGGKPEKGEKKYNLDILCVGAHPDDCEIMAGGTLIKMSGKGYKVGILDLTRGEMGTRGDHEIRAGEAERASEILGVVHRENLGLPDTMVEANVESRLKVIEVIRRLKPRILIAPSEGQRHPDHNNASKLVYDACFFSGLRKYPVKGEPHRPEKILYYLPQGRDITPTFLVDISEQFEDKIEAIKSYHSQFINIKDSIHLTPYVEGIFEKIRHYNGYLGRAARVKYAEGFISNEPIVVDDITDISAPTF